jgi:predicted Ser/Thr protein kinase/tetratricopeptide (TPR) repeat protein
VGKRLAIAALAVVGVAIPLSDARAEPRVVLAPVYAEPDLGDEAAAIALLIRGALPDLVAPLEAVARNTRPTLDRATEILQATKAEMIVLVALDRLGPTLVISAQIVDRAGDIVGKAIGQAPDGTLSELADEVVTALAQLLAVTATPIPEFSIGQLRYFARAERAFVAGDKAAAARALDGAYPLVGLKLPAAQATARALWSDPDLELPARLIACLAGGTPRDVFEISAGDLGPVARSARARAHITLSDADAATAELRGTSPTPSTALARAALAELRQDHAARDSAIAELIADPTPAAAAWLIRLAPGVLPPGLERGVLAAIAKIPDRRIAALGGLRAAEAKVDVETALALVSVVELDTAERARLATVIAGSTSADAIRLHAEIALANGDLREAAAALAQLRRATDPRAALYRGRIAWELGDLDTAAIEFETAKADPERGRILFLKNDQKGVIEMMHDGRDASRMAQVAAAEVALADGKPQEAVAALRRAEELSPGSKDTQARLAVALDAAGDKAGAQKVRARLAKLADPPSIAKIDRGGLGSGSGSGTGSAATTEIPADTPSELSAVIAELLSNFPTDVLGGRGVAIAPMGSGPSLFALRVVDTDRFSSHVAWVLKRPPYVARVMTRDGGRLSDPPSADAMRQRTAATGAATLLAYNLSDEGALHLIAFDATTGSALELRSKIDMNAHDLMEINDTWIIAGLSVLGIAAAIVLFLVIRGWGTVMVGVSLDPSGTNEVLCLVMSHSKQRWSIGDGQRFRETTKEAGPKQSRRSAMMIGPMTKFRVPPGHWYVHLYGVYDQPNKKSRVLDAAFTQDVDVSRGKTDRITFELGPKQAELQIKIIDTDLKSIHVRIDDKGEKLQPDENGDLTMFVGVGNHTLHISAPDISVDRKVAIDTPTLHTVEINMKRERGVMSLKPSTTTPPVGPRDVADAAAAGATRARISASMPEMPSIVGRTPMLAAGSLATPHMVGGVSIDSKPASPDDLLCGRYRVVSVIGKGAMGVVYRARDENLEREVAIKVLVQELRSHPDALRFFTEEAKALAKLNHPNIVSVYDQAFDGLDTFMIMEFVDGRTLDDLLVERTKIPSNTAIALIDQLCAGLAYVHARGIIHRDIKPANIFVSRDKVVKLGDFGLARVTRELSIRKTEIRGTPLYMAPEQITGENVGVQADLYAVGCTLFELITGRPPFMDGEILYHHLHTAPPRPSDLEPTVPASVDELILSCIAKSATDRVQSANAIRDKIRALKK